MTTSRILNHCKRSSMTLKKQFSTNNLGPLSKRLAETDMIILAEGFVFELERRGYLQHGPFVPTVILEEPEIILQLHKETIRAGTDVVLACQYYGHREKLRIIGEEDKLELLNRSALRLAHQANNEYGGKALIAGNLCNTNIFELNNKKIEDQVRGIFREQAEWCAEEKVDFILGETFYFTREAEICLEECNRVGLEANINMAIYSKNEEGVKNVTREGHTVAECFQILQDKGAIVTGLNCFRGPDTTLPLIKEAYNAGFKGPTAAIPMIYRTDEENPTHWTLTKGGSATHFSELESFLCNRLQMAEFTVKAKEMGVKIVGTCCGGWTQHIRSMAEAIGRTTLSSKWSPDMNKHYFLGSDKTLSQKNRQSGLGKENQ